MTREQKREAYSFALLAIVGALILVYTLFLRVEWTYALVALHDYVPDPWGLFVEDSPIVCWLLSL